MTKTVTKEDVSKQNSVFVSAAKEVCNGCDLVTGDENKLTSEEVDGNTFTLDDFATCVIDGESVGVVTFVEHPGKFYWGGLSLTRMVLRFIDIYGDESAAREAYAGERVKVKLSFEMVSTRGKRDFMKVIAE